jgi:superfamily I DNA/RNA helicase
MPKEIKMKSKFPGWCSVCKGKIQAGDEIIWSPATKESKSFVKHIECPVTNEPRISQKNEIVVSSVPPSHYQQRIFDSVLDREAKSNIIVEAVAGSGKTWTITQAVYRLILSGFYPGVVALLLAFNRHIAQELAPKFPSNQVIVKTSNGFGLSLLMKAWRDKRPRVDSEKTWKIFSTKCFDLESMDKEEKSHVRKMFWPISNLISLGKGHGILSADMLSGLWRELSDKFGVDIPDETKYPEFESVLLQCYSLGIEDKTTIDYDDMLFFPVLYKNEMTFPFFPFVFVDEAQDLNPVQIELISLLREKGSRVICVGDTHQAIYGFRGADPYSMQNIRESLLCEEKPLSINYRCPKVAIRYAKEFVSHIEAHDKAIEGEIISESLENLTKITQENDYILCRTMAPLVKSCLQFVALGRKAIVLGRNIGKDLENLIERIANGQGDNLEIDKFMDLLSQWSSNEIEKIQKKNPINLESRIVAITDKVDTIQALSINAKIVSDLYQTIKEIFSDNTESGITLSTIHRCKGLENERITIIYPHLMPHPMAKQKWEVEQEKNLEYVAVTRTKKTLTIVKGQYEEN